MPWKEALPPVSMSKHRMHGISRAGYISLKIVETCPSDRRIFTLVLKALSIISKTY
jgi:hypothetical protein